MGEQRARDDPLKGPLGSSAQPWAAVADPTCTSTSTFTTPLETGIAARPCRLLELPRYLSPQVGIALQLGPDFLLAPAGLVSDKGGLRPGRVLEEVLGTALTPDAQWLRDRREELAASAPLAIRAPVFAIFAAAALPVGLTPTPTPTPTPQPQPQPPNPNPNPNPNPTRTRSRWAASCSWSLRTRTS